MLRQENAPLKCRTPFESDNTYVKINRLTLEEALNSFTELCNRRARAQAGAKESLVDKVFRWRALVGQKHSIDLWIPFCFLPHDAKSAKS